MYQQKQNNKNSQGKSKLLIVIGLLVLSIAAITVLELTDTTYWFHEKEQPISASPDTKGEPDSSAQQPSPDSNTPSSNPSQTESDKSTDADPNAKLRQPTGDFVSSHHVNMSTPLVSVCTTTPGATCKITFTKGTVEKSLEPRLTDRGGSAYWDKITAQSIGLGAGSWKIQAFATLGSQTETANDALNLEVAE